MPHQPVRLGVIGDQGRGQHERDLPLAQDVARLVLHAGFQSPIRNDLEAERISVKIRRLPRIAHEHPNVVNALQCQGIGGHANDPSISRLAQGTLISPPCKGRNHFPPCTEHTYFPPLARSTLIFPPLQSVRTGNIGNSRSGTWVTVTGFIGLPFGTLEWDASVKAAFPLWLASSAPARQEGFPSRLRHRLAPFD